MIKQIASYCAAHWRRYAARNARYADEIGPKRGHMGEFYRGVLGCREGLRHAREEQRHIDCARRIMAAARSGFCS